MDWVHCNNCFQLPDPEKSFFLTSCGHIFCRDCETTCARDTCKLCGNKCNTIALSSSMKPDVQIYFTDPDELLKKKFKEIQKISSFQRNHRARLMSFHRKEQKKYNQMKDGFKKILKNLKELESERKRISHENENLKKYLEMTSLGRAVPLPPSIPRSVGSRKGGNNFAPHDVTPSGSLMNARMSEFLNKCSASSCNSDRMSVFSPPMNSRIGSIPGNPTPSSAFKNLKLNSIGPYNQKTDVNQDKIFTPGCSQESSEFSFTLQMEGLTMPSPSGAWMTARNSNMEYPNKRDPRRVVVHPYSPND